MQNDLLMSLISVWIAYMASCATYMYGVVGVLHVYNMCNIHVSATHVLHLYVYMCREKTCTTHVALHK